MANLMTDLGRIKTASSVGLLVVLLVWESWAPFFAYFVRAGGERTRHALKNLALGVVNAAATGLLFVGVWWSTAAWAERQHFGLLRWVELPVWARLAVAVLLFDAWMYLWHRLNHRVRFLWRFHRTHHSDPRMDVTTANRFHLGEILFSSILRVPVIALLGLQLWELALYEAAMFTVVQLHHANIALPAWLDRGLRAVIVTPFMHKVHHSRWRPETDSNYSSLFSFWDRLFGTLRLREDPRTLQFGLDEFDQPEDQTLSGLLATPLRRRRARQLNRIGTQQEETHHETRHHPLTN
ncbi:MAG TPA: sterol desaturase family protein [Terriglobia bacterium]|nr:sterol desaturase family protein [Terriglobia bacterium]